MKRLRNIVILIIIAVIPAVTFILLKSESNMITFKKTFGGDADDEGRSIQATSDGGYILFGSTTSFSAGRSDMYLVKTDNKGDMLWSKTYGGSGTEKGRFVQQSADGGYMLFGLTDSTGAGGLDMYLIKTDSHGNELWAKTYGGSGYDGGYSFEQTTDGGYILLGTTSSFTNSKANVYLVKTDADGNELWRKTYGGELSNKGRSVKQAPDGGYILLCRTTSFGAGLYDIYVIKTDADGNELWSRTFGGAEDERGDSLLCTSDNNYLLFGYTRSLSNDGRKNMYLIKIDRSGKKLWHKVYDGGADDYGLCALQTTDGGYMLLGEIRGSQDTSAINDLGFARQGEDSTHNDLYLIKTDADGNELWSKTFAVDYPGGGVSLQQTADGGYAILGSTGILGMGGIDMYFIKTDDKGNIDLW